MTTALMQLDHGDITFYPAATGCYIQQAASLCPDLGFFSF
jgi:hypothetical protein